MNPSFTILAFASLKELAANLKLQIFSHNTVLESLIMTGSLMFVITMAVLWVVYHSKKKKRRKYHHHHRREQVIAEVNAAGDDADREQKKFRRRRRRSQPPMNPTLAQTGGLPPLRNTEGSSYLP